MWWEEVQSRFPLSHNHPRTSAATTWEQTHATTNGSVQTSSGLPLFSVRSLDPLLSGRWSRTGWCRKQTHPPESRRRASQSKPLGQLTLWTQRWPWDSQIRTFTVVLQQEPTWSGPHLLVIHLSSQNFGGHPVRRADDGQGLLLHTVAAEQTSHYGGRLRHSACFSSDRISKHLLGTEIKTLDINTKLIYLYTQNSVFLVPFQPQIHFLSGRHNIGGEWEQEGVLFMVFRTFNIYKSGKCGMHVLFKIKKQQNVHIWEEQCGFPPGCGTVNQLYTLCRVPEGLHVFCGLGETS